MDKRFYLLSPIISGFMSLYRVGFRDALELLQKRMKQRQVSDVQNVLLEIEAMNNRVKGLRYHDFQMLEMPQPVLHALFGVISKRYDKSIRNDCALS